MLANGRPDARAIRSASTWSTLNGSVAPIMRSCEGPSPPERIREADSSRHGAAEGDKGRGSSLVRPVATAQAPGRRPEDAPSPRPAEPSQMMGRSPVAARDQLAADSESGRKAAQRRRHEREMRHRLSAPGSLRRGSAEGMRASSGAAPLLAFPRPRLRATPPGGRSRHRPAPPPAPPSAPGTEASPPRHGPRPRSAGPDRETLATARRSLRRAARGPGGRGREARSILRH